MQRFTFGIDDTRAAVSRAGMCRDNIHKAKEDKNIADVLCDFCAGGLMFSYRNTARVERGCI